RPDFPVHFLWRTEISVEIAAEIPKTAKSGIALIAQASPTCSIYGAICFRFPCEYLFGNFAQLLLQTNATSSSLLCSNRRKKNLRRGDEKRRLLDRFCRGCSSRNSGRDWRSAGIQTLHQRH